MFGRARHLRFGKPVSARYRILGSERLEPRTMMSGTGVGTMGPSNPPPTVAHAISAAGGSTISGKTASLSVLGSDVEGAAKLIYDWSITGEPTGGSAAFSTNNTNAAANTSLTFTKAGTYDVSVKIIDAIGLSVTNTLVVNVTPTLTSVKLSTPSNTTLSASTSLQVAAASQSLVAQGLDQFGNALAAQPTFKWSTASLPSGAAMPTASGSGATETFTFSKIGSYAESVQATGAGGVTLTAKAALQVVAKPTYFVVSQVGGSTPITGTTAQFTASQLQDQFHNAIAGSLPLSWAATNSPAGAAVPTFAVSGSTTTVTFKAAGSYVLTATESDSLGDRVSQSIVETVVSQAAGVAKTSTAAVTVTGTSQRLTNPTIVDQFGNALSVQPAVSWSVTTLPSGAATPTLATASGVTTVTFAAAGIYSLSAKVGSVSFVTTATVVPTLTSLVVTPGTVSLNSGATQQFVVQALDQFKHALSAQSTFTWSVSGGTINTSGLFTAPSSAASYTVTAHDGSLTGTATVSVVASSSGGLQNAFLSQLVQSLDADGSISRNDMIQILDSVSAKGAVTTSELADLKKIVSEATTLNMAGYVQVLASDVVNGNTANATYQGQALGNLAVGSSATQLNDLVGKWFLGTDLPTLTDSSLVYKTAAGSLFPTTPSHNNELQGELGDCYFISALGTIADKNPAAIENMFINNGDGTYTVRFYTGNYGSSYNSSDGSYSDGFTGGSGTADYVTVNLSLATTSSGMLYYSDYGSSYSNANNALWIPLAEKAYAEWNQTGKEGRDGQNSFASIEGGWMATVDAQVLGHNATDYMMGTATQQQLVNALASGEAVTIGTTQTIYGLYGSHAYAVTGYNASSNTFTLYNPWGFDQPGQLTWAQLEASCSGFVAVNASGSTAISGAPKVVVGAAIKSDAISAASAASAGQDAAAANDAWFASGASASVTDHASHDLAQQSGSDTVARFAASNSTGSSTSTSTGDDHLSGDHQSLETEAHSHLSSLAIKGLSSAAAAEAWAIHV